MKGIVFTEFLEMVEARFSADMVDDVLEAGELPSGGAYTAVGTYDHAELVELVGRLAAQTGMPPATLVREFGRHLFARFVNLYPQLFGGITSAFDFLMRIETYIHVQVKKLYPDAELPRFECHMLEPGHMEMLYRSSRPFADLAEGLIVGCAEHFGEVITVHREPGGAPAEVRFVLSQQADAAQWTP